MIKYCSGNYTLQDMAWNFLSFFIVKSQYTGICLRERDSGLTYFKILTYKLTYFTYICQKILKINFALGSPIRVRIPRSFPISKHCNPRKLHKGTWVLKGWKCLLMLTRHGAPTQVRPHSEKVCLNSPPQQFTRQQPNK